MRTTTLYAALLLFSVLGPGAALADAGDSASGSSLAPYQKLIEAGNYQKAVSELDQAVREKPGDADLLNLLAYSHRKLDHFDIAMDFYLQALKIDPDHRGANEYLGELYLQLGQLDKAEERLAVLDKECFFGCEEYDELKQAIEAYRKNNPS